MVLVIYDIDIGPHTYEGSHIKCAPSTYNLLPNVEIWDIYDNIPHNRNNQWCRCDILLYHNLDNLCVLCTKALMGSPYNLVWIYFSNLNHLSWSWIKILWYYEEWMVVELYYLQWPKLKENSSWKLSQNRR